MGVPKIPELDRRSRNASILLARLRIAEDLGLMDKDTTFGTIMEDDYKGE